MPEQILTPDELEKVVAFMECTLKRMHYDS